MLTPKEKELLYIVDQFAAWYNENDCPWTEGSFCPRFDELKAEYEDEVPEDERYDIGFDPSDSCNCEIQGECYVEYYRKQHEQNNKIEGESK